MFQFLFFYSQKSSKRERQMDKKNFVYIFFKLLSISTFFSWEKNAPKGVKCNAVDKNSIPFNILNSFVLYLLG